MKLNAKSNKSIQSNKAKKIKIKKNISIPVFTLRVKDTHSRIRRVIIFGENLNFKEVIVYTRGVFLSKSVTMFSELTPAIKVFESTVILCRSIQKTSLCTSSGIT